MCFVSGELSSTYHLLYCQRGKPNHLSCPNKHVSQDAAYQQETAHCAHPILIRGWSPVFVNYLPFEGSSVVSSLPPKGVSLSVPYWSWKWKWEGYLLYALPELSTRGQSQLVPELHPPGGGGQFTQGDLVPSGSTTCKFGCPLPVPRVGRWKQVRMREVSGQASWIWDGVVSGKGQERTRLPWTWTQLLHGFCLDDRIKWVVPSLTEQYLFGISCRSPGLPGWH